MTNLKLPFFGCPQVKFWPRRGPFYLGGNYTEDLKNQNQEADSHLILSFQVIFMMTMIPHEIPCNYATHCKQSGAMKRMRYEPETAKRRNN